ncbi:MAG TPA: hypothetical protein VHW23_03910 [Kofleriaceae bacterium]|jgi:hypothetical protein|nr:hypothetical protein [Kofleriaceae bacterium]
MSKPRHSILSPALFAAVALAAAGCSSGNSQPPLPLSESNATSVAAEALITTGQSSFTVQLPGGVITTGVAAALRSLPPRAAQRLTALATGPQNADGTMTTACPVSGTATVTTAGTMVTYTFNACVQDASTKIEGSLQFTVKQSSTNQVALSATFDLTVTSGALSFAESGGYTIALTAAQNPTDDTRYELTGDRLDVALSAGGVVRDEVTLSSFDVVIDQQLTSTDQQVQHFTYDVDSSRLKGHITVMTTQDVQQSIDPIQPTQYPFAGQILVAGANHTRLQITILGDETFTPPAGQGQIELEIDPGTGTFGAPIWTSWAELSAMVAVGP